MSEDTKKEGAVVVTRGELLELITGKRRIVGLPDDAQSTGDPTDVIYLFFQSAQWGDRLDQDRVFPCARVEDTPTAPEATPWKPGREFL